MKKYILNSFKEIERVHFSNNDDEMYKTLLGKGYVISNMTADGYDFVRKGECSISEVAEDGSIRTCDPTHYLKATIAESDEISENGLDVKLYHVKKLLLQLENGDVNFDDVLNFKT